MAAHRSSFGKLERDRAKKAKAAVKRERRQSRAADDTGTGARIGVGGGDGTVKAELRGAVGLADAELSPGELLRMVEALHHDFEAKLISFEDYEERKADILSRLPVD